MDDVWKLVYDSFEKGFHGSFGPAIGVSAQRTQLQGSILQKVATYKAQHDIQILDELTAEIRVANAMGFITDETTNKIETLIDEIRK